MKKLILLLSVVVVIISGCYMGITYKIIDSDTKQPIKGAVVNVAWTKTHGIPGLTYSEIYKTVENTSNENGEISIEGCYDIFANSPRITVYKNGYVAWNHEFIFPNWEKRKDRKWESRTINLEKFNTQYPVLNPEYSEAIYRNNNYEWDGSSSFNPKYTHYRHMNFISSCLIVWSGNKMKTQLEQEDKKADKDRHALITFKISGRIVDKNSHERISGAVIKLLGKRLGYSDCEAVSDENGNVSITGKARLLAEPPLIVIEKKGYYIFGFEYRRWEELDFWAGLRNGFVIDLKKCDDKHPGGCFK